MSRLSTHKTSTIKPLMRISIVTSLHRYIITPLHHFTATPTQLQPPSGLGIAAVEKRG